MFLLQKKVCFEKIRKKNLLDKKKVCFDKKARFEQKKGLEKNNSCIIFI